MNDEPIEDIGSARALMHRHIAELRRDPAYVAKEGRIAQYRSVSFNNQTHTLFYRIGNDDLSALEYGKAKAFLDFCAALGESSRERARKLSNSCAQAIKPDRAAQSIALARALFGDFHPHFCASALDDRQLSIESRKASWLAMPAEKRPSAERFSVAEAATTRRLAHAAFGALPWQLRSASTRACYNSDPATLAILLDAGFPHSGSDDNDNTPLFMALRGFSRHLGGEANPGLECARLLLAKGADPNAAHYRKPGTVDTPLATALSHKNWPAAHLLLDSGADPYAAIGDDPSPIETMMAHEPMRARAMAIQEQADLVAHAQTSQEAVPPSKPGRL
jgi:hypothetical protein